MDQLNYSSPHTTSVATLLPHSTMDSSPIPSPAFTNGTQSTNLTSASSIRSNLKYHMSDIKSVLLKRATSFKVQRGRFLVLVKLYEDAHVGVLEYVSVIGHILAQNSNPHAQHLASEMFDIFLPIGAEFKAYMIRIRLAIDMFNGLSALEHRSAELHEELEQAQNEYHRAPPSRKQSLREDSLRKEAEYAAFQVNFRAMTEKIYNEIFYELSRNICLHLNLLQNAANSLMQAITRFPQLEEHLRGSSTAV